VAAFAVSSTLFDPAVVEPWVLGLAVISQQLFFLQQVLFRANLRFRAAAGQLSVSAVATPALGIPLMRLGVDGLILARLLVAVIVIGIATRRLPRLPRPRWQPDVALSLISVGAPVMLAGLVFVLLITIDRWLVDAWLGREAVGQYGIVTMGVAGLLVIPTFLSQQLYPHLSHERGAGADGHRILASSVRFGFVAGGLTALAGVAVSGAALVLVPVALPAYVPALGPLAIGCAAVSTYAVSSGLGYVLNLTGRQRALVLAQVAALIADVTLAAVFANAGLGLASFPLALLITFAMYGVSVYILAHRAAHRDVEALP
jgi:O-antigen/teichoic acid export membrane protein